MSDIRDPLLLASNTASQPTNPKPTTPKTSKDQVPEKKWWYSDKVKKKPDAELLLEADWKIWPCLVALRELIPFTTIIFAIVLGAKWDTFDLTNTSILNFGVDIDEQLAIIGLINKVLDTFVRASLSHTASICITSWMIREKPQGVNLLDFELQKELTEPWTCVINFYKKTYLLGWKGIGYPGLFRFFSCLAVSVCVLLLGSAVNTIGIPKQRWYPNIGQGGWKLTDAVKKELTITTPRMALNGLDWNNCWNSAWNLVGSGPSSWDSALAIAAASTYTLLSGLPDAYTSQPAGWLPIGNEVPGSTTAINTIINGSTVQTISVKDSRVQDIYNDLKSNGPESFYKDSSGWNGYINMTLPFLTTSCSSGLEINSSVPIGEIGINELENSSSTLAILIGAIPSLNFTGATCTMTLNQVLFPVGTWIINNPGIDTSINNYQGNMTALPIYLPPTSNDHTITQTLGTQLGTTVSHMNGLFDTGLVYHMVLISRRLRYLNSAFSSSSTNIAQNENETDTAGITPVIAVITQHLITIANWNMTKDQQEKITSYPVRWQVYGAGPRLAWEWTASLILATILIALLTGVVLTGYWHIEAGPWLDVGGMLLAANQADRMEIIDGSVMGIASRKAREGKFFVREVDVGVVRLVDTIQGNARVRKGQKYLNEGYEIEYSRAWNWDALIDFGRTLVGWLKYVFRGLRWRKFGKERRAVMERLGEGYGRTEDVNLTVLPTSS